MNTKSAANNQKRQVLVTAGRAPTLLIVGSKDLPVVELNQKAIAYLHTEKQLVLVPGATHLFEEPGALDQVARLASQWLSKYSTSVKER